MSNFKPVWTTRSYREGDMMKLLELTEIATGKAMHIEKWRWLFEQCPGGKAVFKLGEHKDKIVGQYVIVPQKMIVDGKETLGALSCETITHSEYRKQGMFVTLAKEVFSKAVEQGVSIIYGFPNANSFHGFANRLGFDNFSVPFYIRPLKSEKLFRKKFPAGWLGELMGYSCQWFYDNIFCRHQSERFLGCRISLKNHLDDSFDDLWKRAKSMYSNVVIRDCSYLKWRYMSKANPAYTILGAEDLAGKLRAYMVFRCYQRNGIHQGHIYDLFSDQDGQNLILPLLNRGLQIMQEEGAEIAVCLLMRESSYLHALKKVGFFRAPNKKLTFVFRLNIPQVKEIPISDLSRWHITLGDSDFA